MPEYVTGYITVSDLSKGLNTEDPVSKVPEGYYVDCQNMVLGNKSPITIGGLTKLNTTAVPDDGAITWCEPHTTDAGVTVMVVATDQGNIYKYDVATDTWTTLLLGLSTTRTIWTHVPSLGKLIFSNGVDRPIKFDGTNALFVGNMFVASMDADEDWNGVFTRPPTSNPDLRRVGSSSIQIRSGRNAILTFADSPMDFLTGIDGAADFAGTDYFRIWVYRGTRSPSGTVTFTFRDATTPTTKHFDKTSTISNTGWTELSILRSDFANTGSAVWTNIGSFKILVNSGNNFIFDRASFEYASPAPVGKYVELYNQQLVIAGIESDPVGLVYSDPGAIDYFDPDNTAHFSGGRHVFEKTDQITALRSYFDELIVGKVNSAWTFSGTGTNVSISALPLTIGIDGHRAIAETPWSLQYPFENNIFGARLTSRGLVSTYVSTLLEDLDGDECESTVAIRHDRSRTVRWSFRTTDATDDQNDLGLIYDYSMDAWCCTYSPQVAYYSRGIVDGNREVFVVQYDGYIRRADVGTDFDGTPIESWVTLPYMQSSAGDNAGKVVRWYDATVYVRGTADVLVQARFADEPHQFDTATFETFGTVQATPDADKGYVSLGRTARWMQLRLKATSGSFEVLLPIVIGHADTSRRI